MAPAGESPIGDFSQGATLTSDDGRNDDGDRESRSEMGEEERRVAQSA